METKKIMWSKMCKKEYGGNCQNFNGNCGDAECAKNWQLALSELATAEYHSSCEGKDTRRTIYLRKKINELKTYVIN